MQRVVGRVEIEHEHLRVARETTHAQLQKRRLHRLWVRVQLAVIIRVLRAEFEAVERRRAGQRRAAMPGASPLHAEDVLFSCRRREQWIQAQPRVIIEILVAEGECVDALGEQLAHAVNHQSGDAAIGETSGQRAGDGEARIDLAQQQSAAIRAEQAAGKIGDHFAAIKFLKKERLAETLCLAGRGRCCVYKLFHTNIIHSALAPVTLECVIFPG